MRYWAMQRAVGAGLLFVAAAANAEPANDDPTATFSFVDLDGNGVVTQAESQLNPDVAIFFFRWDQDDNQVLDTGEFALFEEAREAEKVPE